MPLSSFRFLSAERERHENEHYRMLVLTHFVKDPQALIDRLERLLDDEDEAVPSAAAQVTSLLAALPGDAINWLPKGTIAQELAEAQTKQAEMDAALASGDMARVQEVMRRQAAG